VGFARFICTAVSIASSILSPLNPLSQHLTERDHNILSTRRVIATNRSWWDNGGTAEGTPRSVEVGCRNQGRNEI